MRTNRLVVLILLALYVAAVLHGSAPAANAASGRTLYVSTAGSDANPGTVAAPFRTVTRGLRVLQAGDTLLVRGGVYAEVAYAGDLAGTEAAPIVVGAMPGETVTIRGRLRLDRPSYVTVQGLRLTRPEASTPADLAASMLTVNGGHHWTVRDNEVFDTVGYAALAIGGDARDYQVVGNCLHDVGATHPAGQDHGMYIVTNAASGRGHIERNIVYGTPNGTAMKIGKTPDAGHPEGLSPHDVIVRHNTFYNSMVNVRVVWGADAIRLDHNVIVRATWADSRPGGQPRVNVQGYCTWGTGLVVSANVMWDADAAVDHFHGASCLPAHTWTALASVDNQRVNPVLRAPTTCSGFQNGVAGTVAYGRYAPVDQALAGRWSGGSIDAPATVVGNRVAQRLSASAAAAAPVRYRTFDFAARGDVIVGGDWDGDGVDGVGAYRESTRTWYLRNGSTAGAADATVEWGLAGGQAFTGDFNGDGRTDIAVARDGVVYQKYHPFRGSGHDRSYRYGDGTTRYVAGDWDGDGTATVGYVDGVTWHLHPCNAASCATADAVFDYGTPGDRFVVGDWNGDGRDTVATVTTANQWRLRDGVNGGRPDVTFTFDR